MDFNLLILAAGEGTRMKSSLTKVLHPIMGRPMLSYVLDLAGKLNPQKIAVVIGKDGDKVQELLGEYSFNVEVAVQTERLGTGHAVLAAESIFQNVDLPLVVIYGDNPFLQAETIKNLVDTYYAAKASATVLTIKPNDPHGYGRIMKDQKGELLGIVEEKDCTEEQRKIKEVNAGSYCFNTKELFISLKKVTPQNKQKEIYLTDVIGILVGEGKRVVPVKTEEEWQTIGVDSRQKLALANKIMQRRINDYWMSEGVSIIDPNSTWIETGVSIAGNTTLHPGTFLRGATKIGKNCELGPNVDISDATIADNARIEYAVVRKSQIGEHATLGPFCYLRNNVIISDNVKVGTFVEIKNSLIGNKTKVPHLSYVGDAEIGEGVNIGAGSITCNYNGEKKNKTFIDDEAFIGSDTLFIAPVKVGKKAVTGAGSVIRKDVSDNEVVAGVPARKIKDKEIGE